MNENIDLTKILNDCPEGTELYSPLCGKVVFKCIKNSMIYTTDSSNSIQLFSNEGFYYYSAGVECLLFPSAEQRDWRRFKAHWYKNERFNTETLAPFDKVIVRNSIHEYWRCDFFSHIETNHSLFPYTTIRGHYSYCIPYNEETKHLVGTKDEAPEYYRYLED